jgi:hypothetical protein
MSTNIDFGCAKILHSKVLGEAKIYSDFFGGKTALETPVADRENRWPEQLVKT